MKTTLQSWFEALREEPQRLIYLALSAFLLIWILRGCLPGNQLPNEVATEIERGRVECITAEETAIRPGETRQPECGRMNVDMVRQGVVPPEEKTNGVAEAICYRVTIENPRWETMGQTRHELIWTGRSYSKVAVLVNGEWQTFPDEYLKDEQRWLEYGCPGAFASE